jgi:apolipoprotein N-acyltransferase
VVHVPGLPPFQPLVCYEVIFPEFRVPASSPEFPQWIVNLTNDGWYGETSGPYQHFLAARLRAIEQGLPLVRAANTGISAVIDAYGRVCSFQPLGVEGVIELVLPLHNIKTVYREWGDWILLLQIFAMCSIIFMPQRRKCFGGNQDLKS